MKQPVKDAPKSLTYTPDKDIRVHEEGAIRLICASFQSHENGLPEWLKNAADEYARTDVPEEGREIVLFFDNGRRDGHKSISVLDFCGMSSGVIESDFRVWADPEAASRGSRGAPVQGGHGNGGKCYMTQMFDQFALVHTVKLGKGNRYGVEGGKIIFGYIPDREHGRDYPVADLRKELQSALKRIGCTVDKLPKDAIKALDKASGFTLVTGVGPKGYERKMPVPQLTASLQEHPQMIRTLELCRVRVMVNGEPLERGHALTLPVIPAIEGAEKGKDIPIPKKLKDPLSGQEISTTNTGAMPPGVLLLRTSKVSMRWAKKYRHNIIYRAKSGYIGYVPVDELDVQSAYRDRIYGECVLEALEHFKQNDRSRLARSPLTRAVERFIADQVEQYGKEFESRDRRRSDKEEKTALSKMNEALDKWKNRFLNELMRGVWGPGDGSGLPPPTPPLPAGKVARMELNMSHNRAGIGVAFRPTLKFFDAEGRRVRAVDVIWVSDDNNVAFVDPDLSVVTTLSEGITSIYAETVKGSVVSNKVPLEVVRIRDIKITPTELEMPVGGRQRFDALCKLDSGEMTSDLYLIWTEGNAGVARVSAAGSVFALGIGETEVVAGDDRFIAGQPARVRVVEGSGAGPNGHRGRGYPVVLVSGEIDIDPDTGQYVQLSADHPPVYQRPQDADRNIWWINSSAPLARLYLDAAAGYGYESREWRMYHLERFIEVIVQIALVADDDPSSLSIGDWITKWGSKVAPIQAAAAADLTDFLTTGNLPQA